MYDPNNPNVDRLHNTCYLIIVAIKLRYLGYRISNKYY